MRYLKEIYSLVSNYFSGSKCPKCGEWIDADEDVCQICGYPWSD